MVLGETISISGEALVLILAIFLLFLAAVVAIVIVGIVSAYRSGRGDRSLAPRVFWPLCAAAEGLVLVAGLTDPNGLSIATAGTALGATLLAYRIGRRRR